MTDLTAPGPRAPNRLPLPPATEYANPAQQNHYAQNNYAAPGAFALLEILYSTSLAFAWIAVRMRSAHSWWILAPLALLHLVGYWAMVSVGFDEFWREVLPFLPGLMYTIVSAAPTCRRGVDHSSDR